VNQVGPGPKAELDEEKDVKKISKTKPARNLFGELREGMTALAEARQGKRTLLTHAVQTSRCQKLRRRN
jgi:hypothetical protein